MAERRVVPDNSVMLPGFFAETIRYKNQDFDLTRRAKPLLAAIQSRSIVTFAPDILLHEFTKEVCEWAWPRAGHPSRADPDSAEQQVRAFFRLPITYTPAEQLAELAWGYMTQHKLGPQDCWYLACAVHYDAELWVSHEHADGLVEKSRQIHEKVYILTERRFESR